MPFVGSSDARSVIFGHRTVKHELNNGCRYKMGNSNDGADRFLSYNRNEGLGAGSRS